LAKTLVCKCLKYCVFYATVGFDTAAAANPDTHTFHQGRCPTHGGGDIRAGARRGRAGPRCHHDSADLTAKTRGMPMPPSKRPPAVWGHTARQGARRIPAVTGRVVPVGRPSAPWLCGASRPGRSVCMRERRVLVRETRPKKRGNACESKNRSVGGAHRWYLCRRNVNR
jgi:hypothetical protein